MCVTSTPLVYQLPPPLADRVVLSAHYFEGTPCWDWLGSWNSGNGYYKVRWRGRGWMVHRLIYTLVREPVPQDLVLDHLCARRWCCNPLHMEPVTVRENTLRGQAVLFQTGGEDGRREPR